MSVPSWKGCATAAPELASGPCHRSPLHAMQMKAAAVRFLRSAQPPAFCTSRCAWLAVRKQLGVLLFTRFHQLCPFRKHWCCLQRHQSRQSILLTAHRPGTTAQEGSGCQAHPRQVTHVRRGNRVFQMTEGIPKGNYPAFLSILLMEDGERATGCGTLPLHVAASHNS